MTLFRLITAFVVIFWMSGCVWFDRRDQVALRTLNVDATDPFGLNEEVYKAALERRFPDGTSVDELIRYVVATAKRASASHPTYGVRFALGAVFVG